MEATTIAALARMTREDSKKLLTQEYYPSWVVFSQKQKLSYIPNFTFLQLIYVFTMSLAI